MAAHDGLGTRVWSLALRKGARDRMGEDAVASRLALHALAGACSEALYPGAPGLPPRDTLELMSDETPQVMSLAHGAGACSLRVPPRDTLELSSDETPQVTPMAHALQSWSPCPWSDGFIPK